jgi:cytochrome d ubiquinol oxidase subunit I
MLAVIACSLWLWRRNALHSKVILRAWMVMTPAGFIAVLAGWYTTEIGRQPYIIYGLLKTADAASAVSSASVLTSLLVFGCVYLFVFTSGVWYLLKLLRKGPQPADASQLNPEFKSASHPISMADSFEALK